MKRGLDWIGCVMMAFCLSACGGGSADVAEEHHAQHDHLVGQVAAFDPEPLDLDSFIGESVTLQGRYAAALKQIVADIKFPANHKLLPKARPHIALYHRDGRPIQGQIISSSHIQMNIAERLDVDQVYAKLGIYYCRQGEQGLCLMQNVLYKIFLSPSSNNDIVQLKYDLEGSDF